MQMTTFEERVLSGDEPKPWRPEPGDVLVGTVVELGERPSQFGGTYPTITVSTESGELVVVHALRKVLRDELEQQSPVPGERVGFQYHGVAEGGYHRYKVRVDRPGRAA
jgi:hypothetical protein